MDVGCILQDLVCSHGTGIYTYTYPKNQINIPFYGRWFWNLQGPWIKKCRPRLKVCSQIPICRGDVEGIGCLTCSLGFYRYGNWSGTGDLQFCWILWRCLLNFARCPPQFFRFKFESTVNNSVPTDFWMFDISLSQRHHVHVIFILALFKFEWFETK